MHSRYFCQRCGTELALNMPLCGNCAPNASALRPKPEPGPFTVAAAGEVIAAATAGDRAELRAMTDDMRATWVGEDSLPPEDAAPIPQRKVMGDIIVADAAPERIAPATVPAEYLAATGRLPNPDAGHGAGDGQGGEDFPPYRTVADEVARVAEPVWKRRTLAEWAATPESDPDERRKAPAAPLEMTIELRAPRAQADALAAKLREELAALGPGATVTVVPAAEFPTPGRCPACGHLVVDHTSGANGTGGCSAEGCSCGHGYQSARDLARDRKALPADPLDPTTLLNEPSPLQKLLEQDKGAWTPGESRTVLNPLSADARDALLGIGRGAGIPLRQACETLKATLEWVAAVAPPSEYQRWTRAFDALDRVTRHCARTFYTDRGDEANTWQKHVCAAWARALGQEGVTVHNAPTVLDLQDATATVRAREHTRGTNVALRMWAGALSIPLREVYAPEELIEHTLALVEREAEQQHVITNLQQRVDDHRATLVSLTNAQVDSGSVNENLAALRELETLARTYERELNLWRKTKSPDDQAHWDAMDEARDAIEAWVKAHPPEGPAPAAPEAPDPAVAGQDAANGEAPGSEETDNDIPF